MSDIQLNVGANQQSKKNEISESVETAGAVANAKNSTPSPLFNVASETAGSIASNTSSSSGGFSVNA